MAATRALVDAASTASADWLVRTSWQTGVLVVAVVAIQLLLGHKRLPPRWAYALWMLVVVRLLMPAVPHSPWSVFNLKVPTSWARGIEASRPGTMEPTGPAAEAATARNLPARMLEGTRVTVGIIDGAERHATSSVVVTPKSIAQPAVAPFAPSTQFDWKQFGLMRFVVFAWIAGAVIALLRVFTALLMLRRRIRGGTGADATTLALLHRCRREMGLGERSSPQLLVTDAVSGPALFGFLRPVMLVPTRLIAELSREELRFVFLHELAHLRRRDPLANALLVLASAVHWFNPLVRFALARCRAERELACDELVMSRVDRSPATTTDAPASEYGQAVLRVAQALRPSARRVPVAAVGMIHTRSQLRRRIAMIATYTPPAVGRRSSRLPRVALPTLLVLLVASCALTDGATKSPTSKPAPSSGDAAPPAQAESSRQAAPESGAVASDSVGVSKTDAAMNTAMDRILPELKFDGVPFADVMESLRDQTNVNLLVDWRALEAAGIDRNTPVTTRVRNVKFSKALRIILDHVGGDIVKLGYAIDGNILNVSTADSLAKDTVTRVYDIRDIIIEVPDYVAEKTAPQTRPTDPAKTRAQYIEQVTDLIKETVDADSWRENGGSVGSLRELQGQLIITQTQENQRSIALLLDQLRETHAIQITVESRFVTLDPAALDESLRQKLVMTFQGKDKPSATFLTDEDAASLLRASQQQKESTIITAPRLTLFNGQRAFVMAATQRAYVSGYTATKQADGKAKWEPIVSSAEAGVTLDVMAVCSADRKYATLTLRPELTKLVAVRDEPFHGSPDAPSDLMIQVPQITAQRLQTTVNVPDGHILLLGGLMAELDATGQPTTRPTGNLYMLVKPTLLIQKEIDAKAEARAKP
jgi:beta-lactamase regulating signal transducer with metallopeptidase domain